MVKLLQDSRNKSICHIVRVQDKLVDCYSQVYTWDRIWFIVFSPHCLCLWFLTSNLIHWHSNRFFSSLCLWKSVFSTDFQIKKKKKQTWFQRKCIRVCRWERERERDFICLHHRLYCQKIFVWNQAPLFIQRNRGRRKNIDNLLLVTKQFYRHSIEHIQSFNSDSNVIGNTLCFLAFCIRENPESLER